MKQSRKSILHFMLCFILITGCDLLNQVEEDVPDTIEVEDVNITIIDGDYNNQLKIELNTSTKNAIISYTLDGSTPSRDSGSTYSDPFIVNESGTIKAMAYVDINGTVIESRIISESISFKVADPRIIPGGVTFSGTIIVSIISATDDAYIRYTTDGTVPTETIGETYDGSFTLSESVTVRAKAYREGFEESDIVYEEFVLDDELPQVSGIIWKGSLSYAPYNPEVNWAYYNTSDGISYIYNGYSWDILAQDGNTGSDGSDGQNGTDGQDGRSIIWQGSLDYFPYSPELNWAFYNNIEGISYIYDGYSWNILARDGVIGEDGVDGINGVNGIDGLSIIWKGTYISAPDSPELNWGYYNSFEGISYIWTGSEWSIITKDGGISSVVAPVMIPGGTTFSVPTLVTMFTTTNEAIIRYTTDGSDPDEYTGQLYSEPLLIEYSTTLKAVAYRDGMNTSPITTMNYIINRVDDPVFDLLGGDFSAIQSVTVTTTTSDATLYYTIDGSNPSSYNYEDYGNNSVTITVDKSMTLRVIAMKDGYIASGVVEEIYNIENVVSPPDFDLAEGYYTTAQTLNITTETEGAIIYYTLNGSTPSSSYYEGSGGSISLDITTAVTVKAIAVKTGWTDSTVTQQTYTITGTVAEPEFTILSGTYVPGTDVHISSPTSGSTIYYTLDGTTPTDINYDGSGYNGVTITLTDSVTINAIAVKDYWDDSILVYEEYVITDSVATPQFDILGDLFNTTQSVVITTDTVGATIYYTTDGTDPSAENYFDFGTDSVTAIVDQSLTLKAIAVMDGMPASDISSEVYTIDTVAPVITLNGNIEIYKSLNTTYIELGATATDDIDGDISDFVIVLGSVNTNIIGTYSVTYNVLDSAGNSAVEVVRTVHVTSAGTMVLPNIDSNTTWTLANSPYNITYNTTVEEGVTLTIEPGVVVKIDEGLAMLIDGSIIAQGTEDSRITFINRGTQNWKNLVISALSSGTTLDASNNYASGNIFKYVDFINGGKNATEGMLEVYNNNGYFDNCKLENSEFRGLYLKNNTGINANSSIIRNSVISDMLGHNPIYIYNLQDVIITNTNFENNNSGLHFDSIYNIVITDCSFEQTTIYSHSYNNYNVSVSNSIFSSISEGHVIHCRFHYSFNLNASINSNTFINNAVKGLYLSSCSRYSSDNNSILSFSNNVIQNNINSQNLLDTRGVSEINNNTITGNQSNSNYSLLKVVGFTKLIGNTITNNESEGKNILEVYPNYYEHENNFSSIINNKITNNMGDASIRTDSDTNNKIRICNNVLNNPESNYELFNANAFQDSSVVMNIMFNYWGFTDSFTILGRIYDYVDDSSLEKTDYTPYALDDTIGDMVCQPIFNMESGTYSGTQSIHISTYSPDATVYYTLDGSEPSDVNYDGSGLESVIVEVTASSTVKAVAIHNNYNNSEIISMDYVIQ